jgi:MFS family permease
MEEADMARSRERVALGLLCSAQLMLIVDVVALNVALPSLQRSLGIATSQLQLAGVAYTLTFGSLLVVAGRAGDLLGRRRLFQIGLTVFVGADRHLAGTRQRARAGAGGSHRGCRNPVKWSGIR